MNTTVIVASLASATALAASSSLTPAMPESADPIFALIERHRAAFADDVAFTEHQDARGNEVGGIQLALAETRPATLAGVIAIIQYEREHRTNFPGCHLFPSDDEAGEALDPRAKLGNWLATIDRSIAEIARVNPSLAVPELAAPAVATPTILEDTPAGALVRFEMTLATLRDRYICDGWSLDEKAAEQVLQYFRERAAAGTWAIDEDSPEEMAKEQTARDFLQEHGQSLDWVICGDLHVQICRGAAGSARATRSDAELERLVDECMAAEGEWLQLGEEADRLCGVKQKTKKTPRSYRAACNARDVADERVSNLIEQVVEMPARTVRGLVAKARCCDLVYGDVMEDSNGGDFLRTFLRDLPALQARAVS
jgi:hypothetical protein